MNTPTRPRGRLRRGAVALGTAALLTTVLTTGTPAAGAAPRACTPTWTVEQAPVQTDAKISAVTVHGKNDVVFAENRQGGGSRTLTWDGTALREDDAQIPGPVGIDQGFFRTTGMSYDSPSSGWAMVSGDIPTMGLNMANPLARWDGTRWTLVPGAVSPRPAEGGAELAGVASVAPDDAWAVGNVGSSGALIEHWDGTRWTVVDQPAAGTRYAYLQKVAAVSATDVWAAGSGRDAEGNAQALVLRYDGTAWQRVTLPEELATAQVFTIDVDGAGDVWLGGMTGSPLDPTTWKPVLTRWDGERWDAVPDVPRGQFDASYVRDVYVAGTDDVWAVVAPSYTQVMVAHWDGTAWTEVKPQGAQPSEYIYDYVAIEGAGPNEVWAVGEAATIEPPNGPVPMPQVRSGQLLAHLTCGGK
ncbi:hypothetical protein AQ490_21930 [Wenjunlia vitaminophila]|uniref:Uncharacterized protein n=1 Tax=Wenjunlia vitaminophila TaxID=76728 RepID=A0A0T6LSG6_WENVI|nr:hypothetical protein [Wenjunlia vitaminophila]KRV48982.1 hypothetical protein AQ490_21930 [Wenjunlia vitaminophila]